MARAGLAIAGGFAGRLVGGPLGGSIGFTLGNLLGGVLFGDQTEGQVIEGPRLNDLSVVTSTYGRGIAIPYGGVPATGNIIWAKDIVEVRTATETGGGGGGKGAPSQPSTTQVAYSYFGNFAVAFGEGPIELIRRVWFDGKLVIDLSEANSGNRLFKHGQDHYRLYFGDETQLPDPLIEATEGAGLVPGHRGMIYIVCENYPLAAHGNSLPRFIKAELVTTKTANFAQDALTISTPHNRSNTQMDFHEPFAVDINGTTVTKFNRINGDEVFRVDVSQDQDLIDDIVTQGFNANIANSTTGARPFIDPTNGDIYVGLEGTTGQGGGFSVWDKNMTFLQFRHLGTFGAPRHGAVLPMGGARVVLINKDIAGVLRPDLVSFVWNVDPLNPASGRGTLGPQKDILDDTAITWLDFAYDPANAKEEGGGRGWSVGNDSGDSVHMVQVFSDGSFGSITAMTGLGVPSGAEAFGIAYDINTDSLLLVTNTAVFKLDPETFAILKEIGTAGNPSSDSDTVGQVGGFTSNMMSNQLTLQGLLHTIADGPAGDKHFVRYSTQDLTILARHTDTDVFPAPLGQFEEGPFWDPVLPALFASDGGYRRYFFDRYAVGSILLRDIATDLVLRVGLAASDIDVTDPTMATVVRGYIIDNPSTSRAGMEPLQAAFFFDVAEIDFKLVFKGRDNAPTVTIPSTELAARIEDDPEPQKINEPRRQEVEIPRRVTVSYMNPDNDFNLGTQIDQRIQEIPAENLKGITKSKHAFDMRLPIVLTDQEARDIVAQTLMSAWVERTSIDIKAPPKYVRLDPTDVIIVQKITEALTSDLKVRIMETDIGRGGVLQLRGLLQEAAIYTPNVVATPSGSAPAAPIPFPVQTEMFLLNLPSLRGFLDEDGGAWFGAAPSYFVANPDWIGAALFKALTSDGAFVPEGAVVVETNWGLAKSVMAVTSRFTVFDDTNTFDVQVQTGTALSSVSDITLFAGANFAYMPSTGELLQFGTATLVGDRRYTLSHLLRGRLGTEGNIAANSVNAQVIFISTTLMARISSSAERGLQRFFQAVTLGSDTQPTPTKNFTNISESLLPLPVSDVVGARDGSDNLTITWKRRTRFNGEWLDLVDVPLNEGIEQYSIDILDQPNPGATVLRTITVNDVQTASYTAAEQSGDGLTPGDPVDIEVFQVSEVVGRGKVLAITV